MPFRPFAAVVLLVTAALLFSGCGAVNWNQEPPYSLILSWGGKGSEPGKFNDPTGIAVTPTEVFVSDARNNRIQVFDKEGNFLRAFGQEHLGRPMNLDIANNTLYVPDYFKDVVHVFSLAGQYQKVVRTDPPLKSPGGIAVDKDGSLLVADTYGQRIVHLSPEGMLKRSWSGQGFWSGQFNYPTDVALATHQPGFYVADGYNDRVQQFAPNGEFVRQWGGLFGLNVPGPFKGWFMVATSIAVSPEGHVFVADFYNDRIQKFTADGDYLTTFGKAPDHPGHSEFAVAVDTDGTVWTVNFADNRIEKWRPGS